MTLVERIKKEAKKHGMNLKQTAAKAGIGVNSIYRWKTQNPTSDSLNKVAKVLGVSTDYLLNGNDHQAPSGQTNKKYYDLNDKEKADIAVQAEKLIEGLESGAEVNFYGEPATDEQKNRLRIAIQMAMEMNKQEAKKKFTPKKYRD